MPGWEPWRDGVADKSGVRWDGGRRFAPEDMMRTLLDGESKEERERECEMRWDKDGVAHGYRLESRTNEIIQISEIIA